MPNFHRVVITGIGAVTPIGNNIDEYLVGLQTGTNGVSDITLFDPEQHPCKFAAEVKNLQSENFIEAKESKRWDRFSQFGVIAAKQAFNDSGLEITESNASRIGVIIGSGVGGLLTMESQAQILSHKGPKRVSPFTVPMMIPNMATGLAAIALGAKGPSSSVSTACAAGSNAIGDSFRLLQLGKADAMICGGAEASITPLGVAGFASAKALSFRNESPQTASRPFDAERDGFVIGEGSGILVLETLENAQKRDARIYAEIIGYGTTCDAHHITAPSPGGVGGAEAIKLAIEDSSISLEKIDYINAHGTSTPAGDITELNAINSVFGQDLPMISSTKSLSGHSLGAAGVHESIFSLIMMKEGFVVGSANIENLDEGAADFPIVRENTKKELNKILSNSFGFGGTNATLIFEKV